MAHDTTKPRTPTTGIPFWDMMLSLGTQPATPAAARIASEATASIEVIALGAETLHASTRIVAGDTTRVRRVVVETPAEQTVTLREERVVVERRKPSAATLAHGAHEHLFTELTVEMSDSFEVAEAWTSARVVEEVVLRREVTTRTETVRGTVRHDELVLEQSSRTLPAPKREVQPRAKRDVTVPGVQQVTPPTPTQLAADLAAVAERFDNAVAEQDKALATLHDTIQPEAPQDASKPGHIPLDAPKAEKPRKG